MLESEPNSDAQCATPSSTSNTDTFINHKVFPKLQQTEWICWGQFVHYVFITVVELQNDLEVWKWFKSANYNGTLEIEAPVKNQNFKIYGGPKHTEAIYQQLKSNIKKSKFRLINNLQFLVISEFNGCEIVYMMWKRRGCEIAVDAILKNYIDSYNEAFNTKCGYDLAFKLSFSAAYCWSKLLNNVDYQKFYSEFDSVIPSRPLVDYDSTTTRELCSMVTWRATYADCSRWSTWSIRLPQKLG